MFIVLRKKTIVIFIVVVFALNLLLAASHFLMNKQSRGSKSVNEVEPQYIILIYIEEKKLYLFEAGKCIKKYTIASGKPSWPSPIGSWKITEKGSWGEGFGGRWLGLNVPWGKYGIHGTTKENTIGKAASHGCIRMFNRDIKELYYLVPIGTQVVIKNGPFGPFGTGFRVLRPGDRGADVLAVQQRLKGLGYFEGRESGIYEDNLKSALHRFQKDKNLKVKDLIEITEYNAMGFKEFE